MTVATAQVIDRRDDVQRARDFRTEGEERGLILGWGAPTVPTYRFDLNHGSFAIPKELSKLSDVLHLAREPAPSDRYGEHRAMARLNYFARKRWDRKEHDLFRKTVRRGEPEQQTNVDFRA